MPFPIDLERDSYPSAPEEVQEKPPPRPSNAWILYRSDRLRDIADGIALPALEGIKSELGISSDSDEKSVSSSAEDIDNGDAKKSTAAKSSRKGSKKPSEGILNLGKGKTGRGIPQADISKLISMMWARESNVVKKEYDNLATRRKEEVRTMSHVAFPIGLIW